MADNKTLRVTVELLQDQIQSLRKEKQQYEERANMFLSSKRREKELEQELEEEKNTKVNKISRENSYFST